MHHFAHFGHAGGAPVLFFLAIVVLVALAVGGRRDQNKP